MSKPVKRKITVSVSPKPKSLTKSRPSVFERLGTKTGTSSLHKEYCHHWAQNGTCPFGKTCKYSSTHTLISPSKQRAAKKESESKKRHTKENAQKRLPPAPGEEEWDNWDPEELADADPDDLEKRRQELQRELEIQMKMDTKARKKDKKVKRESSPSESSTSSETSSSTDESSSSSSSSVEARKRKAKKAKKHDTSSSSDCDRKKHKSAKAVKHTGTIKIKVKTDKLKKTSIVGKTKVLGAMSPTPVKVLRKESRTPPLKTKSIPVLRKKSTSRSPRPLSRDKKEKHRSPSPKERDHRDKERDRERDKERDKEKERMLEKEREREKDRERERLKLKDNRDKENLKKKERSPPKKVDERKRRDSPERKVSPSRSRNGSNSGRRDIHKSPTRDDKRHACNDYPSSSKRASGKDNGNISSSSDKQQRSKDIAVKRDHSRDDREREREQLREQREQRERERKIAREEREAAREKEREEALARCQERQRERERIKAEQLRKAAEEEQKRKEMQQQQRRRDDGRDRGLDKPSSDRVERLLPLPSDRMQSSSRKSSMDRDRLGGRERDKRERSPIRNRSAGRKSLDRHDSGPHHHNRKDQEYDSREHRGSDRSDPGCRDYTMQRMLDDREQPRHHRIDDVGKHGRYGSPYDGGRSRSHVDDRRGGGGYGTDYGDNTRDMRLPPPLLDHLTSDDRRRSRERDHWDDQRDSQRDIEHRRYNREDQARPPIQPLVSINTGQPPQQQWPSQSGSGEFAALQTDGGSSTQQIQPLGGQLGADDWTEHQQQSRGIGHGRSNRPIPIEWEPSSTSRDIRDWDRDQNTLQQTLSPIQDQQQQHLVGGSGGNMSHFTLSGGSNRGGSGAAENWQQGGGGGDDVIAGRGGNRRWFGRNDEWRERDKGRIVPINVNAQRDESHQDRRKDISIPKQESEVIRPSTLLSVPLEPCDSTKKEASQPLKRPAELPPEGTTDVKKQCLVQDEPLADDLSEISDDADEILNRDEEILKDEIAEGTTDAVNIGNIDNHASSPIQSHIQEDTKDQKSTISILLHSPCKKNQLLTTQHAASPMRSMKGESIPDDDHMVDNATMDFEEISEDELEEETRVKGLGDALGVDWASLVAESLPRIKPVTSAKRRWEPHNILINLGISVEYAGEELVKKIFQLHHNEKMKLEKEASQEFNKVAKPIQLPLKETNGKTTHETKNYVGKCIKQEIIEPIEEAVAIKEEPADISNTSSDNAVTVKTEPLDGKESTITDENKTGSEQVEVEVEISHPVAVIQVAMRNKLAIRKSLFASAGPYRRALSARRDLAIRRHLCNLPISDIYVESPRRHDPEMFRTALELFSKCR